MISYSSISKRPIFCDPYESFSFFRRLLECLDLEQIKFKFPFLYRFKITPPFQQHFYTAFWFVNNNLKNLLWFSVSWEGRRETESRPVWLPEPTGPLWLVSKPAIARKMTAKSKEFLNIFQTVSRKVIDISNVFLEVPPLMKNFSTWELLVKKENSTPE